MALAELQDDPVAALRDALGAGAVITDPQTCALMGQDMFKAGVTPLAVLRPSDTAQAARAIGLATGMGLSVFPRGGGQSYTDGYQPTGEAGVTLDTGAMTRILEINATDLYVRVEAGVTWAQLDEALREHGVRARFWGPFSGYRATIGGSLSQGSLTFGSARNGSSGANVLGFTIVLADGTVLRTGLDSQRDHHPFLREYGPDLTGIFTNDCGALGVKTEMTLPLEPRPAAVGGVSYVFPTFAALSGALMAVARENLASELLAMDPVVTEQFAGKQNLVQDVKALIAIGRAAGPVRALPRMARIALAGRSILKIEGFHGHFIAEGRSQAELDLALDMIRRIVGDAGVPIAPTVPGMVRAQPFGPLPVIDPKGRRVLPMHAIVPASQVMAAEEACRALIASYAERCEATTVKIAMSYSTVGRNGLLIEPVFYWEDRREAFHETYSPEEMLKSVPLHEDNPAARTLVAEIKQAMIDALNRLGATHLQIGRAYPWLRDRDEAFLTMVHALKARLDPDNRMNPGALGLGA